MFIVLIYLHASVLANQGPRGVQGAPGVMGATGITGARGATGDVGPRGVTGLQGPIGPLGDFGAAGARGFLGPQGLRGDASQDDQKIWLTGDMGLPPFTSCTAVCNQHANAMAPGWSYACVAAKWGTQYVPCDRVDFSFAFPVRCLCWMVTR